MILMHANAHRNFGEMPPAWQERANKKQLIGFHVIYQDGTEQDITGGLASIPDSTIREHGHVKTATAIETEAE